MLDIQNESLISLSAAAGLFPRGRNNKPVTVSCVLRWILDGIIGPDGKTRIRLEAARFGGRWLTTVPAIERFGARQTPQFDDSDKAEVRTPAKRQKAFERAERELAAAGI
jgi:hypothetical protein